jgi:hypothetical protein
VLRHPTALFLLGAVRRVASPCFLLCKRWTEPVDPPPRESECRPVCIALPVRTAIAVPLTCPRSRKNALERPLIDHTVSRSERGALAVIHGLGTIFD